MIIVGFALPTMHRLDCTRDVVLGTPLDDTESITTGYCRVLVQWLWFVGYPGSLRPGGAVSPLIFVEQSSAAPLF